MYIDLGQMRLVWSICLYLVGLYGSKVFWSGLSEVHRKIIAIGIGVIYKKGCLKESYLPHWLTRPSPDSRDRFHKSQGKISGFFLNFETVLDCILTALIPQMFSTNCLSSHCKILFYFSVKLYSVNIVDANFWPHLSDFFIAIAFFFFPGPTSGYLNTLRLLWSEP